MTPTDFLTILERLASAYPEKRLSIDTLTLYQQQLADIPLPLLELAVNRHIQSSSWFPHISDLRQAAATLAGRSDFTVLQDTDHDALGHQAMHLEELYHHSQILDPQAWEELARQLDNTGRYYRAEQLRRKFSHLLELESASQRGEHWPPSEACLRYAKWDSTP